MILMYHKIYPESPTMWWVEVDQFYRQMSELAGKKVVYLDDYDPGNPDHVVITFDGVYHNVLQFAVPIMQKWNYPFEAFLVGDHLGGDNGFDQGEPLAAFIAHADLPRLVMAGGRLQWHTKTHNDLTFVRDSQTICNEFTVPGELKKLDPQGFQWIAYPHGNFNDTVLSEAEKLFRGGLSCHQGGTDKMAFNRITVTNTTSFKKNRVCVIVASYNYGSFLTEAVESVLRQTIPVDEILITDDASTDNTQEIAQDFVDKYPALIKYNRNATNMGIVDHFNKAISMTSAEYICILGADNRLLSNYVEECRRILDISDTTAIAYNDCALFGPRAELAYQQYGDSLRGQVIDNTIYLTNFPEFNETTAQQLNNYNFIHGSSMYRRTAYDAVGGYKSSQEKPEDHGLFLRMVNAGWRACKATKTYLEYRQHSADQANTALNSYYELLFYKRKSHQLERELRDWRTNPLRAFGKYLILPKVLTIYRIIRKDGIRGFIRKLTEYQWRETSQSRTRS